MFLFSSSTSLKACAAGLWGSLCWQIWDGLSGSEKVKEPAALLRAPQWAVSKASWEGPEQGEKQGTGGSRVHFQLWCSPVVSLELVFPHLYKDGGNSLKGLSRRWDETTRKASIYHIVKAQWIAPIKLSKTHWNDFVLFVESVLKLAPSTHHDDESWLKTTF